MASTKVRRMPWSEGARRASEPGTIIGCSRPEARLQPGARSGGRPTGKGRTMKALWFAEAGAEQRPSARGHVRPWPGDEGLRVACTDTFVQLLGRGISVGDGGARALPAGHSASPQTSKSRPRTRPASSCRGSGSVAEAAIQGRRTGRLWALSTQPSRQWKVAATQAGCEPGTARVRFDFRDRCSPAGLGQGPDDEDQSRRPAGRARAHGQDHPLVGRRRRTAKASISARTPASPSPTTTRPRGALQHRWAKFQVGLAPIDLKALQAAAAAAEASARRHSQMTMKRMLITGERRPPTPGIAWCLQSHRCPGFRNSWAPTSTIRKKRRRTGDGRRLLDGQRARHQRAVSFLRRGHRPRKSASGRLGSHSTKDPSVSGSTPWMPRPASSAMSRGPQSPRRRPEPDNLVEEHFGLEVPRARARTGVETPLAELGQLTAGKYLPLPLKLQPHFILRFNTRCCIWPRCRRRPPRRLRSERVPPKGTNQDVRG